MNMRDILDKLDLIEAVEDTDVEPKDNVQNPEQQNRLAPNGKPSNLNPVQYQQVRTPEFKAWFGDWENSPQSASKVVDENGEPMIMYTGTSSDKDFDKFKTPKNGVWFSKSRESAANYAMQNDSQDVKYNPNTGKYDNINTASRVIPVFINIKTPHTSTKSDFDRVNVSNYKAAQAKLFNEFRQAGYDGVQWNSSDWVAIANANQFKSAIGNAGSFSQKSSKIHEKLQ